MSVSLRRRLAMCITGGVFLFFLMDTVFAQLIQPRRDLILLQPLDDSTTSLAPSPPGTIDIFFNYFNLGLPWFFGVAAGIAILNTLVAGVQILFSGGDPSKRSEGMSRLTWSIAGLLILSFAGFILRLINPLFYT